MKIPYFCCIGAELKRYSQDFDFMNQVYLYKVPTDDSIEEVLAQDYFKAVSDTVLQDDIVYIYEPTAHVLHTCRFNKQAGHITAVQLANNVPGLTPNRVLISDSTGHITAGDVTLEYLKNKVNLDGTSIMTGPLKMRSSVSFKCAIAPSWDGVGFYKLNDNDSVTLMASMEATDGLSPAHNNTYNIGTTSRRWKDAYIARVITAVINNGSDIAVPVTNSPDTFALKSEIELAANSGRMITDQGVWFAKMYAATVPPAADDNTNYADFSQTDGDGNPIIVLYERQSGAWIQTQTITPPTNYDGYVPVTSKIWDIADQVGQQGGRVLWNHQSKEFTPYPNIVSFEDAALTGVPTAPTPTNASPDNQIATKEYVDNANPSGTYHPGILAHEWDDHLRNDVSWLRADTFSWQSGAVYQAAYAHLVDDIYVQAYAWYDSDNDRTCYTTSETPEVGDDTYAKSGNSLINRNDDIVSISGDSITTNYGYTWQRKAESDFAVLSVPAQTETIAGTTITYYLAEDGHKVVLPDQESNVLAIYTATGVAWYYIIDYGNERFKLPRTKFAETGLRDTVGNYVEPSLPNITADLSMGDRGANIAASGAAQPRGFASSKFTNLSATASTYDGWGIDASRSSSIYKNNATVQPPATQMYLYFYVGEFTQTALQNTAGITAETLNDKADVGHEVIAFQAPTAANNYTWYRKYADGWIEQGGVKTVETSTYVDVTLPVTMADTGYIINTTSLSTVTDGIRAGHVLTSSKATTGFRFGYINGGTAVTTNFTWEVKGMYAQ